MIVNIKKRTNELSTSAAAAALVSTNVVPDIASALTCLGKNRLAKMPRSFRDAVKRHLTQGYKESLPQVKNGPLVKNDEDIIPSKSTRNITYISKPQVTAQQKILTGNLTTERTLLELIEFIGEPQVFKVVFRGKRDYRFHKEEGVVRLKDSGWKTIITVDGRDLACLGSLDFLQLSK